MSTLAEHRASIESSLNQPIRDLCQVISMTWWDKWCEYANGRTTISPGPINNTDLL